MIARRQGLWLAFAIALVAIASAAGPAGAASAASPTIVAPDGGALVTGKTLRVRVRNAAPGLRVLVSRDVTKRFGRARKGVRRALLRRGRDFSLGRNRLMVTSRRAGGDVTRFVAARRAPGLLRLRRLPRSASRAAVHVRARVRRPVDRVRLTLNGKRVPNRIWPHTRRSFEALLGADEHARFGVNRLVATVIRDEGRYDRVVRRFRVARSAPLVGAGPDRRTKAHRRVRLDGRSTRRAPRGTRLAYRWRIVDAPKGSKARLRGSRSARPSLRPDKRGSYRIRLVAAARRPRRAGAAQAPPSAVDQVTVQAAPAIGPIGMPIQTIASGGGIQVGTGTPVTAGGNWVQLLVLDAATLEQLENNGYDIDEADQLQSDLTSLQNQDEDVLVILSGGGRSFSQNGSCVNGWSQANANALQQAYDMLGGDRNPAGTLYDNGWTLCDGQWSLIGRFGIAAGSAAQNHASSTGSGGQPGSLNGYLQLNHFNQYAFVSPDFASIDTNAPGSAPGTNTIEVNGKSYVSTALPQGSDSGFQVLVLDSQLNEVVNQTFLTNDAVSSNAPQVEAMNALLRSYDPGPAAQNLVIVQSIRIPGGFDTSWLNDQDPARNDPGSWGGTLSGAIGRLGGAGAHDQFAAMVGQARTPVTPSVQGGYTLVASTQLTDPWNDAYSQLQAVSNLQGSTARVVGTLSRNNASQWVIGSPSATGSTPQSQGFDTGALWELAYAPQQAFPLNTGPYLEASQWIAQQLGFTAPDVRTAYWENASDDWDSNASTLARLPFESGNGFTQAQYSALQAQLITEMNYVAKVWNSINTMKQVFTDSTFQNYVNLQNIASDIVADISAQQEIDDSQSSIDPLSVIGSSLWLAQGIAGVTGQEEAEAPLGLMAAGVDLIDSLSTQSPDGGSSTAPITDEAENLGADLAERYTQLSDNFDQIGNLLVSNYAALPQAGRNANGLWALSSTATNAIQLANTAAATGSFYTNLIPVAYGQYVFQWQPSRLNSAPWQDPWNYRCRSASGGNTSPFTGTQNNSPSYVIGARTFGDVNGSTDTFRQIRVISTGIDWVAGVDEQVKDSGQVLPQGIGQDLFRPTYDIGGLGLDQFRFFGNPAFERWNIFCHYDQNG